MVSTSIRHFILFAVVPFILFAISSASSHGTAASCITWNTPALFKHCAPYWIKSHLADGEDPNNVNEHGRTPLINALLHSPGQHTRSIITSLLQYGASPNKPSTERLDTPLLLAALFHEHEIVRKLLEAGADPNLQNQRGDAPLHAALASYYDTENSYDISSVAALLAAGADPNIRNDYNETPIDKLNFGDGMTSQIIRLLSSFDAKLEISKLHADKARHGGHKFTPLSMAVFEGNRNTLRALADLDIDLDARNEDDTTALEVAIQLDARDALANNKLDVSTSLTSFLLQAGTNVNVTGTRGVTPLHWAFGLAAVRDLEPHDSQSRPVSARFLSPELGALDSALIPMVELLLRSGAKPDIQTGDGWSLGHVMSLRGDDIRLGRALVEAGVDVNVQAADGSTWLSQEVQNHARPEIVQLLVESGAFVDVPDERGRTAVHYAARRSAATMLNALVAAGANIHVADKDGLTPLHFASREGGLDTVSVLIRQGATPNVANQEGITPLHFSAERGDSDMVSVLLQNGAALNAQDDGGRTALYLAATTYLPERSRRVAGALLEAGADPDISTLWGDTPLFAAVRYNRETVVKELLRHGAMPNTVNSAGDTALLIASRSHYQNPGIVRELLAAGANPNARDVDQRTALHGVCCGPSSRESVVLLLNAGAQVNVVDGSGSTPLHYASSGAGAGDIVSVLLNMGANPNTSDGNGESPLLLASKSGERLSVVALLNAQASVDATDLEGQTALHKAAARGDREIVNILLGFGADANARDTEGYTPLAYASNESVASALRLFDVPAANYSRTGTTDYCSDVQKVALDAADHACRHEEASRCAMERNRALEVETECGTERKRCQDVIDAHASRDDLDKGLLALALMQSEALAYNVRYSKGEGLSWNVRCTYHPPN